MPVNHADLMTVGAVLSVPVAAGAAAVAGGAGWFTPLYVLAGVAAALGLAYAIQRPSYWLLRRGASAASPVLGWLWLAAYMILPPLIACLGIIGVWSGACWVARRFG